MEKENKKGIEFYFLLVLSILTVVLLGFALVDMKKTGDALNKEGDFQLCRDAGGIPIPNWSGLDLARCDILSR